MKTGFYFRNIRMKYILVFSIFILFFSCKDDRSVNGNDNIQRVSFGSGYDSLSSLIEDDRGNAELYSIRGYWLMNNNKLVEAIPDFQRAIDLDSTNGKYYVGKSEVLIAQKQIGLAKAFLDEAIHKSPGSTEIMLKTSEIYLWAGDYQKTIDWANAALNFDQYLAQAYYLKGMAHQYSKDTVKAVTSFQTAVEQDPMQYNAYMQLGKLYALENHEYADAYYANALRINDKSIEAYYARGLYRQNIKNAEGALEDYNEILELEPNHVAANYNIGFVKLMLLEQPDSAKIFFENASNFAPTYADAIYMLGYCLELEGDNSNALIKYQEALLVQDTHTLAARGVNRLTKQ
jgi:tetratricopeptide (TPR) repeat protein